MNHKKNSGFSFIEILISLFLFSIMLLGLDAIGMFALSRNQDAWMLSVATNQIHSIRERLYALDDNPGLENQIALWNQENHDILQRGKGTVIGKFPEYYITLYWGASKQKACQHHLMHHTGCLNEDNIV